MDIINDDNLPYDFCLKEVAQWERSNGRKVLKAEFIAKGDGTCLERIWPVPIKFSRIRRITGYLVGDLDRFNDAKRREVEDRVPHNV